MKKVALCDIFFLTFDTYFNPDSQPKLSGKLFMLPLLDLQLRKQVLTILLELGFLLIKKRILDSDGIVTNIS